MKKNCLVRNLFIVSFLTLILGCNHSEISIEKKGVNEKIPLNQLQTIDPIEIEAPNFNGNLGENKDLSKLNLEFISKTQNKIIDEKTWLKSIDSELPLYAGTKNFLNVNTDVPQSIPRKFHELDLMGGYNYLSNGVFIYGKEYSKKFIMLITDATRTNVEHFLNFSKFKEPIGHPHGDFTFQSIQWVQIENDILYVSHGHSTYASDSNYLNGYISAIDLNTYKILWTSKPLSCNSSFTIIDDAIVSGYGFTKEKDYLFVLDKKSGIETERIPLDTAADYIIADEDKLFVRTYNRNYVFKIKK